MMRNRGESNIAVAAASIIARDAFERRRKDLERKFGMDLPPGASARVVAAARAFARRYGRDALVEAAKTHFKTMKEL